MTERRSYKHWFIEKHPQTQYDELYDNESSFDAIIWRLEQRALKQLIERFVPCPSKVALLDFACGTGRVLTYLEGWFGSSIGIDISSTMAREARRRVRYSQVIVGDIESDPNLARGPFEVITAFRFFLNAEPELRERVLKALYNRLSQSGVMIANIHGHSPSLRSAAFRLKLLFRSGATINEMRGSEFRRIVEQAGFRVVDSIGLALLTNKISAFIGATTTHAIEHLAYLSGITQLIGSNKIYVLKRD